MRKLMLMTWVLCLVGMAQAQEKFTLNGYVRDASNGEELIGVTVYVKEMQNGVITNPATTG